MTGGAGSAACHAAAGTCPPPTSIAGQRRPATCSAPSTRSSPPPSGSQSTSSARSPWRTAVTASAAARTEAPAPPHPPTTATAAPRRRPAVTASAASASTRTSQVSPSGSDTTCAAPIATACRQTCGGGSARTTTSTLSRRGRPAWPQRSAASSSSTTTGASAQPRRAWGGSSTRSISQPAAAARRSTPSRRSGSDIITSPRPPGSGCGGRSPRVAAAPVLGAAARCGSMPSAAAGSRGAGALRGAAAIGPNVRLACGAAAGTRRAALRGRCCRRGGPLAATQPRAVRSTSPSSSPPRCDLARPPVGRCHSAWRCRDRERGRIMGAVDRPQRWGQLGSRNVVAAVSVGALWKREIRGPPLARGRGARRRWRRRTRDDPRQGGLAGAVGGSAPGGRAEPLPGRIRTTPTVAVTELQCAPWTDPYRGPAARTSCGRSGSLDARGRCSVLRPGQDHHRGLQRARVQPSVPA